MPNIGHLGSPRIADEAERNRLKTSMEELKIPEGGFIARTASRGRTRNAGPGAGLSAASVGNTSKRKGNRCASGPAAPGLRSGPAVVRELIGPEIDRIIVDNAAIHEQIERIWNHGALLSKSAGIL